MACFGSVYFLFLIICTSLSSLVDSIELGNKGTGTSRPRLRPTAAPAGGAATTTTKAPEDNSGVAIYRVINRNTDITCILLKTDAIVEVTYKSEDPQRDSYIPENAMVMGDCSREDIVKMSLEWSGYSLSLSFAKTPGGEHWYLSRVELAVSVDLLQFHSIKTRDKTLRFYNTSMIIPTPVGKSYICDDDVDIDLRTDPEDHPPKDISASLLLRALQVQAFMYRSENFSTPFRCKSQRSFRSEAAPIAVGSTLAIAALATVTGYAIFRYFKVKNVQYNTME